MLALFVLFKKNDSQDICFTAAPYWGLDENEKKWKGKQELQLVQLDMTQTKRDNSTNALALFEIVIEFHTNKHTTVIN